MPSSDGVRLDRASAQMRVLLIEHDARIRRIVKEGLGASGFTVTLAGDSASAIDVLRTQRIDLVLLNLSLPDVDGLALLAAIRAGRPRLTVIALTEREDVRSTLDAFSKGADDCMTKPFSLTEVEARIRARLRSRDEDGSVIQAGSLALNLSSNRAVYGERSVSLSSRESSLLAAFLRRAGEILSRAELLEIVWEIEFDPGSNLVDVYVASLRRKLSPDVIETVRGRGYRLRVRALKTAT